MPPSTNSSTPAVEVLLGNLAERGELAAAGVGEQHVNPPMLLLHRRVESVEVGQIRHVPADPDRVPTDVFDRRVQLGLAASGDDHLRSLGGEPLGGRQTDPACAAGDDRDLTQAGDHNRITREGESGAVRAPAGGQIPKKGSRKS